MTKIIVYAAIVIAAACAVYAWFYQHDTAKINEGVQKQVAADIAASNQNIATRRVTDATFDKMDAAAVCAEYGLKWVYSNDKSHCE